MEINSLQELAELINLLRKQGVKSIQMGEFAMELGEAPQKPTRKRRSKDEELMEEASPFNPGFIPPPVTVSLKDRAMEEASQELTEDQLLNWSSGM